MRPTDTKLFAVKNSMSNVMKGAQAQMLFWFILNRQKRQLSDSIVTLIYLHNYADIAEWDKQSEVLFIPRAAIATSSINYRANYYPRWFRIS